MVALTPYLAGIVVVISRALLIHLFERGLRGLALDLIVAAGLNALYAVLNRAMDEEVEPVREITQYMVSAAANDDAGGPLCHLADDVGLCEIELIGQAHAVKADRAEHGQRVKEAVGRALVELLEQLFIKTSLFCRARDQLAVIKRNTKTEREFLADFTTACAVFTADSNNQVVIHNASSLPDELYILHNPLYYYHTSFRHKCQ